MRTTAQNICEAFEGLPDGEARWVNVYGWSSDVPETVHDGHAVVPVAVTDNEPEHPAECAVTIRVACRACGVEFDALDGEIVGVEL